MIKIIYCIMRKPSLSYMEFLSYWQDVHGQMVVDNQENLRLSRYLQTSHVTHPFAKRVEHRKALQEPYDGVAELYWDNEEDFRYAFESDVGIQVQKMLAADEFNFIDHSRSCRWIAHENGAIQATGNRTQTG